MGKNELQLHEEIAKLKKKVALLIAFLRVVTTLLRVSGFRLDRHQRLPEGKAKLAILKSIERSSRALPTKSVLGVAHLSAARYHVWKMSELDCGLDDRSSCPHTSPSQLLPKEVVCIKEMATSEEYRHMPISSLALFAQRIGKVYASATTWAKLIRERGWRRPRRRLYPAKPKVGVRATRPNQYWHLDVTVIKLLDGTRVYLHSVIDNFSRMILGYHIADRLEPFGTCKILIEAARYLKDKSENLKIVTDKGVENVNDLVDGFLDFSQLNRVLAQVEVSFSNSMIESFWKSLRYNWLYLHTLDSIATIRRLVDFYVKEHNYSIPRPLFGGQTPSERYFGDSKNVVERLEKARLQARQNRLETNRAILCGECLNTNAGIEDGIIPIPGTKEMPLPASIPT